MGIKGIKTIFNKIISFSPYSFLLLFLAYILADVFTSEQTYHYSSDRTISKILLIFLTLFSFFLAILFAFKNKENAKEKIRDKTLVILIISWLILCFLPVINDLLRKNFSSNSLILFAYPFASLSLFLFWLFYPKDLIDIRKFQIAFIFINVLIFFLLLFYYFNVQTVPLSSLNFRMPILSHVYILIGISPMCFPLFKNNKFSFLYCAFILFAILLSDKGTPLIAYGIFLYCTLLFNLKGRIKKIANIFTLCILIFGICLMLVDSIALKSSILLKFADESIIIRIKGYNSLIKEIGKFSPAEFIFGRGTSAVINFRGLAAHNDFLEYMFDYGFVGLAAFLLFFYSFVLFAFENISFEQKNRVFYSKILISLIFYSILMFSAIFTNTNFAFFISLGAVSLFEIKNLPDKKENELAVPENINLKCTGCKLCEKICPKSAISFAKCSNGYSYPFVDQYKCIKCGLCVKKCSAFTHKKSQNATAFNIYSSLSEDISLSSSGGFAFDFAKEAIIKGADVYGVIWDSNKKCAVHKRIDLSNIELTRKSKYVKADITPLYSEIKRSISNNKKIVVFGLPCENYALFKYFENDLESICFIDLFCGGAVDKHFLKLYWNEIEKKKNCSIKGLDFRDKKYGCKILCTSIQTSTGETKYLNGNDNTYILLTGSKFVRPSCLSCNLGFFESTSDYKIGDVFGKIDRSKGKSLVLKFSTKDFFDQIFNKIISENENKEITSEKAYEIALARSKNKISRTNNDLKRAYFDQTNFCKDINSLGFSKAVKKNIVKKMSIKQKIYFYLPYKIKNKVTK